MLGLIVISIWVAIAVIFYSSPVDIAFAASFDNLFYWHMAVGCILCVGIPFILAVVGFFMAILSSGAEKAVGLGALFSAPLFMIVFAITTALFAGGSYLWWDASCTVIDDKTVSLTFSEWNMSKFVLGCILYGIGLLGQLTGSSSSRNSKSGS